MAHSRRRTPIIGNAACRSERDDKRIWHGRMRAAERVALARRDDDTPTIGPRNVSDPWGMGKDGKHRFDQERWPRLMRK